MDPMRESTMHFFAAAMGETIDKKDAKNDTMSGFYMSHRNDQKIYQEQ